MESQSHLSLQLPVELLSVASTACGTQQSLPTDVLQSPVQAFIDCHLDLHSSTHWDNKGPDEATTGCSGCCNSSGAHGRDHVICHAITRRPSLVASGTASYLQNCCARLDVNQFIYLVY